MCCQTPEGGSAAPVWEFLLFPAVDGNYYQAPFPLMSVKEHAHTNTRNMHTHTHITCARLWTPSQTFRLRLNHSQKIKDTLLALQREREGEFERKSSSSTALLLFHSLPLSPCVLQRLHRSACTLQPVSTVQLVPWRLTVTSAKVRATRI